LQALGKTLVHVGAAGAGHAVKALNNFVSASGLLAVCEALVAAEKFGIDPHLVNQVFNASTGKNNTTEHKCLPRTYRIQTIPPRTRDKGVLGIRTPGVIPVDW
jgi:3-hydroxyisobutyrate dehydrogenase